MSDVVRARDGRDGRPEPARDPEQRVACPNPVGARGHLEVPCARCLASASIDLAAPIHMTYGRATDEELAAEVEMTDDDVDFSTFDGEEIDLGALFREQILLAIPMTPLCRPECKGLCSQCGKDLNEGPCTCERPADPRLGALKGIKLLT